MNLNQACANILAQLTELVNQIHEPDFTRPAETLSRSTIGQHLRHTLEFFICFENGFQQGLVNYDKRAHDKRMESDKFIALSTIDRIRDFVHQLEEKAMRLEVGYDLEREDFITIETTAMAGMVRPMLDSAEPTARFMPVCKRLRRAARNATAAATGAWRSNPAAGSAPSGSHTPPA